VEPRAGKTMGLSELRKRWVMTMPTIDAGAGEVPSA